MIEMKILIKRVDKLSKKELNFMNKSRHKEYGKGSSVNFKKEDKGGLFFFVKDNRKIVAFGMIKPVRVSLDKKKYTLYGIGRILALRKSRGYGKVLMNTIFSQLKEKRKSSLGFTGKANFFKKVGFKVSKNLIKKFRYKNPKTGKIIKDDDGYSIYYEGEDKLITKLLKSKSLAYIEVPFW